ncbi:MAG: hypothetical protein HEP71_29435 [Roseivirga sp.]|nr:hypothetical protein [Roseivirga sp.]
MTWQKQGNIFTPDQQRPWIQSHASLPIAQHLNEDIFRIFFSSRDEQNRSHIGFLDFDLKSRCIEHISERSILSPGPVGSFDMNGISPGSVISYKGRLYLYYMGWGATKNGQFNNVIGLAISDPTHTSFTKVRENPIIGLDSKDSLNLTYPFVMKMREGLQLWYGSNLHWGDGIRPMHHHIKSAQSKDGLNWNKDDKVAIDLDNSDEFAVLRPTVIFEDGLYKMWYGYKGAAYRIGYATSEDEVYWQRKDEDCGINPSASGWDSKEVTYPYVFVHQGSKYLLYNGNQYGKTGFGLAIWED